MKVSDIVKKGLTPLAYLNGIGMAVGGVWILQVGPWQVLWPAIVAFMASPLVFPFLMLPAVMCAGIMNTITVPYPRAAKVMMLLSLSWFITVFSGYMMMSFTIVGALLHGDTLIPALLWSVAAGMMPWVVFAMKDRENVFFTVLVMMTEVTAVIVVVTAVLAALPFWSGFFLFWAVLAGMLCVQAVCEKLFSKKKPQ